MVQMEVVSSHNGSLPGAGLIKNKNSNGTDSSNGNGLVKAAGSGGGGQGGKAPRKLTKNEKRRQKNRQRKAQASEGAVADKSMAESNGVAVASWPPPAKEEAPDVQVGVVFGVRRGGGRGRWVRADLLSLFTLGVWPQQALLL